MARNLDTEELEAIAMCFDNIRSMRRMHPEMAGQNDDLALGDTFDESLTYMIA